MSDQVDILLDIVGDRQSRNWRGLKDLQTGRVAKEYKLEQV